MAAGTKPTTEARRHGEKIGSSVHRIIGRSGTPLTPPITRSPDDPITRYFRLLSRSFFNRDPRRVARELLGKLVVRRHGRKVLAGRIVEVEAYLGLNDLAAHAAAGRTARNEVLWGPPGHAYVYFIYGVHYCLNISCLPDGEAGCVLIRALEPVASLKEMARARKLKSLNFESARDLRRLASGPGRLCEALSITRPRDNGKDMVSRRSDLQVKHDGFRAGKVLVTPRVGIVKSADMPLRYVLAENQFVSRHRAATTE